jgi:hypothetical protein
MKNTAVQDGPCHHHNHRTQHGAKKIRFKPQIRRVIILNTYYFRPDEKLTFMHFSLRIINAKTIIMFKTNFCVRDYTYIIIWRHRNSKNFRRAENLRLCMMDKFNEKYRTYITFKKQTQQYTLLTVITYHNICTD